MGSQLPHPWQGQGTDHEEGAMQPHMRSTGRGLAPGCRESRTTQALGSLGFRGSGWAGQSPAAGLPWPCPSAGPL